MFLRSEGYVTVTTSRSGKPPSHRVRLIATWSPSGGVNPASRLHKRWSVAWGSEIRTSSDMSDDQISLALHFPDAEHRDGCLALVVLGLGKVGDVPQAANMLFAS